MGSGGRRMTSESEIVHQKAIKWLESIRKSLSSGAFYAAYRNFTDLTQAGLVMGDQRLVFVCEYLEWLSVNLRPALLTKGDNSVRKEALSILVESIQIVQLSLETDEGLEKHLADLVRLRFLATTMQATSIRQAQFNRERAGSLRELLGDG
jgi:hypothetical protein